ncbi:arginine--tRNA ligase [Paenibacillus xylaniclasticus]|uniref:arginine--tRNA ligase n=1 Tax=Paenibacillus xylaniclasticus TaxID=588083 RepID=UPI000FD89FA2|nr:MULTISPECIES: arginine--tRNA ligase [Paenibacillus]GFN30058.1 arginine--tRNA ligase [Paenibacillus curdlanolyticus]
MRHFETLIVKEISSLLEGMPENEVAALIEFPPNAEMGDISLPCFKLSKILRKPPKAIADELKDRINLEFVDRVESVSGYLNFFLNNQLFASDVIKTILQQGEQYGASKVGDGKTIVIDYSSPNIAKPFHIAHLRSTVIGNALYKIYSFQGYKCIGINHLGDWGTQFGKLIVAYQRWGDAKEVENGGIDELLRLYVKFHDEAENNKDLEEEARAWFVKMENGDEEALRLWEWFVNISLNEFMRIYDMLGINFDYFTGESFYNDKIGDVVKLLDNKGLLEEDQGAWLVNLSEYEMAPALILKKDGGSLYHTRDITAAIYRKNIYNFDKAIYITDYAQNLHFQQWFKVVELMGYDWYKDLIHVAFGRVSFEGASLSTRKGNIVKLEDVLKQSVSKIKTIIETRSTNVDNIDEVARQVGVGAVVFNDLSSNRIKDISFSWDDILNFDGETGPYVQYTYARTKSILAKSYQQYGHHNDNLNILTEYLNDNVSFALLKKLSLFGERVELAAQKLEPSVITRYLIELAQDFNRFYHECKILVEDKGEREARIALVQCVSITLSNGLKLIGLETPERI